MPRLRKLKTAPTEDFKRAYNELTRAVDQLLKMRGSGGISVRWVAGIPLLTGEKPPAATPLLRLVELTATLEVESSAAAVFMERDGEEWISTEEEVTVWGTGIRTFAGASGDRAWVFNTDSDHWEVIQLECG